MVADLIKFNVASDEMRKFLNPILLKSPDVDEFVIRDHVNSAERTIHHEVGKVMPYYLAQAPVDTRPAAKPLALNLQTNSSGQTRGSPMDVDNIQDLDQQGIYGVDQDGRCWHCQSTLPHETSPCAWPVVCFRCLQPGHRVAECSNPKHKDAKDSFKRWKPAGGAKRGGPSGGQQGARGGGLPTQKQASLEPLGEFIARISIPGLPKLPPGDMKVLILEDLQHDFMLGRKFLAQLVPKGKPLGIRFREIKLNAYLQTVLFFCGP